MAQKRRRADVLLHEAGLAPSRERAKAIILAGRVRVGSRRVEKPGDLLPADTALEVEGIAVPFVSRGGLKLDHGLGRFGVDPAGRKCLDLGASTGGFTDCLLRRGASSVVAVDVGRGQLDWSLRRDERVVVLEGVNARNLLPVDVGEPPDLVVADLSFISLEKVLPSAVRCAPDAELVILVKPQFEAGPRRVGKGGVVRDPATWRDVLRSVAESLAGLERPVVGATASPVRGPAGNVEFLFHARPQRAEAALSEPDLDELLEAAIAEAAGVLAPGAVPSSLRSEDAPR